MFSVCVSVMYDEPYLFCSYDARNQMLTKVKLLNKCIATHYRQFSTVSKMKYH